MEQLEGFVLHARPYLESSQLLTLLTPLYGRCVAVWRGGRRLSRKDGGPSGQPFQKLWVRLRHGRGSVATLYGVEPVGPCSGLHGRVLWSGLYVNELLYRLLPERDPVPLIYAAYADLIAQLTTPLSDLALAWCLRCFEYTLLHHLGYGFPVWVDALGDLVHAERHYVYHPDNGLVPCLTVDTGISGADLRCLLGEGAAPGAQTLAACRRFLQQIIERLMGPIRTPRLAAPSACLSLA